MQKKILKRNNCKKISVYLGDVHAIGDGVFDIVVANINRNVLLEDIGKYADHLAEKGVLLLSGFYESDLEQIISEANEHHLKFDRNLKKNDWVAARFLKKS
ncbi:MAG: 50S ribosomal protein L11 methyltransferase [Bacteroidales bacterium]